MASTNFQFDDQKIADLIWEDQGDQSEALETEVLFDAPIANGAQTATVRITRTYRVSAKKAKQFLSQSMK